VRIRGSRDLESEWRWRNIIKDWDRTGLNGAAYCRERGLVYSQFRDWRLEIKRRDAELAEEEEEEMKADRHLPNRTADSTSAGAESGTPTDRKSEQHWRLVMAEWRASGLSQAEYCRQRGIKYGQFTDWMQRIRKIDAIAEISTQRSMSRQLLAQKANLPVQSLQEQTVQTRSVEFAEVQVVDSQRHDSEEASPATVEITLPSGIRLSLRQCTVQYLVALVTRLEDR